ncbi:MAG: diguanylate cyclase [Planctomycetota bacterium]|nr:diguanylate cyclase [Planctomycetota bacterium]
MSFFAELRELEEQGIDLIEILGQDRHLHSPADLQEIINRLSRSGESLYGELLYYLTYRRFPIEEAEGHWTAIMEHKRRLQKELGRDVAFRVAALEYLSSQTGLLRGVHLVARPEFERVLSYVNLDEVSGVYSRRYLNSQLSRELARARRYGNPLSLLLIDLDGFKGVNDTLGHLEGDSVLRKVGHLLRDSTRQADSVCRFGGDEFAILLPETSSSEAYRTAERIRESIATVTVRGASGEPGPLTTSVGGATFPADCDEAEELLCLADQMCLDAKRAGKNRVRLYGQGREPQLEL